VEYGEYLVSMMIVFSALMVSQIEYEAMPDKFHTRANRLKLLYIVILALAALIRPRLLMFPILLLYIATGVIKEAIRVVKITRSGRGDALEQNDDDESGPTDGRT
jgi:phosphatidylserine synthase